MNIFLNFQDGFFTVRFILLYCNRAKWKSSTLAYMARGEAQEGKTGFVCSTMHSRLDEREPQY
jgi:hypothetical protein